MFKCRIRLIDGTVITSGDRSGTPFPVEDGDIAKTLEYVKKNNSPISFNPDNMEPFEVNGKDLKSIEFILDE